MTRVTLFGLHDAVVARALRAKGLHVTIASREDGLARLPMLDPAPSVVVVDMRGGLEVPPIVNALRRSHPELGIVLIVSSLDPNVLLDAMHAGASEVLADGFDVEELARIIIRLDAERPVHVQGAVFVVVGAKGGTGATTVAVNVATELAREDRTLLIDLHPSGGDAALLLNAQPKHSFDEALKDTDRVDQALLQGLVVHVGSNCDLLAAPDRPLVDPVRHSSLQRLTAFLSTVYRYTVIDLDVADLELLRALGRIDTVVLVVTQELTAIRAASRLLPWLRATVGERAVVVLNRFDRHFDFPQADIEGMLGTLVVETLPSAYRRALHAVNVGQPLVLEGSGGLVESLKHLAHHLAGSAELPEDRGVLQRLVHASAA